MLMKRLIPQVNLCLQPVYILLACLSGILSYAQCTPAGDQTTYGTNQWIGYVYSDTNAYLTTPATVNAATYRGFITEADAFDRDYAAGSVSGTNLCGAYADNFGIKYKMRKVYSPGYYSITVGADDGYRLSIDGGATFLTALSDWTPHAYLSKTATVYLSGSTDLVLEFFERTGNARVSFSTAYAGCDNTAPTSITATASALDCVTTTTTLTASGGTLAAGGTYQWGTGTVAGQNIISGQSAASVTVSPSATAVYWVRRVNASPCGGYSDAAYTTISVTPPAGNPAVFGDNTWNVYGYNGSNLDLTADTYKGYYTQGTLGFDSTAAWDTNGAISSAPGWQGCTVPADMFTFVHKRKGFPCGRYTVTMKRWDDEAIVYINGVQVWYKASWSGGIVTDIVGIFDLNENSTIEVRVRDINSNANAVMTLTPSAVPPTYISGNANLYCNSASTVLTAAAGSVSGNTVYQWGIGTVGENVLTGQTGPSITVSPVVNTTYWVRLADYNACSYYSSAVTANVTVSGTPGNPAEYGDFSWNAYAYSGNSLALSNVSYLGYYIQNTLGFDTTSGTNSWTATTSPSSAAGFMGCNVPNDNFVLVYKRRGFNCGSYQLAFTRWDDDAELYIDGVKVWSKAVWSGSAPLNDIVGTYTLNENSTVEFRVHENTGSCNATLVITPLSVVSTAPSAIAAPSVALCGGNATLTAMGGTLGAGASYQWGTGTVGSNIIASATGVSVTVNPQVTTTYWVRIKNNNCGTYTSAATVTVNATVTIPGILSSAITTVCKNSLPQAITLSGHTGNIVKWQYANDAAFTSGVTDIANNTTSLTPAQIGPLTATRYFRAVVQNGACSQLTTPVFQLTVPAPVVWDGSWSAMPSVNTAVEVRSALTLDSDLNVCSCEVKNNAVFTVSSGVNLTVKGKITVAQGSNLVVQNNASILQADNVANEGNIEFHRNSSKVKRLDYTMWSSPVDGQQLLAFSPQTLTNRFYEYVTATNQYAAIAPQSNFEAGKGYLIRTPNNHPVTATVYAGTFTGTPHNGTIERQVYQTGTDSYNAIGNPYPSPISVQQFIDANSANIEGTLWFWRKTNDYTQSSYTTLTKLAYVANRAPGGENEYAVDPNGVINAGQGFIVLSKNGGNVVFTNNMRVGNSSNQFFRMSSQEDPASRFWLNLTDNNGLFSQAVVGYTPEATLGYDNGIDGRAFTDNNINLYSLQGDNKLAIQGRPAFTATDVVPLGIKATAAGSYTFALGDKDGLFAQGQKVYVADAQTGSVTDLSQTSYTFATDAGTFENRFRIVYSETALGTDNPVFTASQAVVYAQGRQVAVSAPQNIKSVAVYDVLGKLLFEKNNIAATSYTSADLNATQQLLIVKVTFEDNQAVSKNIMLK